MKHFHDDELSSWLSAEARGDDRTAEAALEQAFRRLARPSPSPGFAERVLTRTRGAQAEEVVPQRWTVGAFGVLRSLVVLSLISLMMLVTTAWLVGAAHPGWMGLPFEGFGLSTLTELAAGLFGAVVQSLASLAALFVKIYDVVSLAGHRAARSETAAMGVVVSFVLAWSAFGALRFLITRERKFGYAST